MSELFRSFISAFIVLCIVVLASASAVNDVHHVVPDISATEAQSKEVHSFQAEVSRLMDIIINSLYSNRDIFLRELISNASDALDKIRFLSLTDPALLGEGKDASLDIEIQANPDENFLVIRDRGIGMSKDELIYNLGTVARSGTSEFIKSLAQSSDSMHLVGQFGCGFYSAFLVAEKVKVISKKSNDSYYVWESDSHDSYVVYSLEDGSTSIKDHGTEIVLYLKEDAQEYLNQDKLESIISRYSEFIEFPIFLYTSKVVEKEAVEQTVEDFEVTEEGDSSESKTETISETVYEWKHINEHKPLWTREKSDISDDDYKSFFKAVYREETDPLSWSHFKGEGEVEFTSLLFVPGTISHNFYDQYYKIKSSLKLYVKRVLITEELDGIVPNYMNFIKGVVDSDSLPINVSREQLQETKLLKIIGKRLVKKVLQMLEKLASTDDTLEDGTHPYDKFWSMYSRNIKLGILEDHKNQDALLSLLRFKSTHSDEKMTSLSSYMERMPEEQKNIYYIAGENVDAVRNSPMLEELKNRGFEVLYFVDSLDEYLTQQVREYEGITLMSVSKEGFEFGDQEESKDLEQDTKLCEIIKDVLDDKVEKVVISKRISKSPAVVVTSQWAWSANMERIMKAQPMGDVERMKFMISKKTLEINPKHPLMMKIYQTYQETASASDQLKDVIELMYDTALMSSGFVHDNPSDMVARIHRSLQSSLGEVVSYPKTEETVEHDEL